MLVKFIKYTVFAGLLSVQATLTNAADIPWTDEPIVIETRFDLSKKDTYKDIPWSLGMTALDAMKMANGLKFKGEWNRKWSGWLINSIAGIDNEGAGKKNWLLCVNGLEAGVGAGSYVLGPGAAVIWSFENNYPPKNCK